MSSSQPKRPLQPKTASTRHETSTRASTNQVFAYFPDARNTDSIQIHINGEIISLDHWEYQRE